MKRFFALTLILLSISSLRVDANTVVGIHGFMADSKSLIPMKQALEACCMDVCLWDYDSRAYSFCLHAQRLVDYLQCIAQNKPGEPIDFVAHSTGALVLRIALNDPCCPQEAKIGRAVLVAPPNRGSALARKFQNNTLVRLALGSQSGRELMTWSPQDITALGCFPGSMQVLVLSGNRGLHILFDGQQNDRWLAVWETCMETPHQHCTLFATHSELLYFNSSRSLAVNFLTQARCAAVDHEEPTLVEKETEPKALIATSSLSETEAKDE